MKLILAGDRSLEISNEEDLKSLAALKSAIRRCIPEANYCGVHIHAGMQPLSETNIHKTRVATLILGGDSSPKKKIDSPVETFERELSEWSSEDSDHTTI
jgi:hypothetical protein